MAIVEKERMHKKSKHLTIDDRESLYQCLMRGLNLTDTAKYLKCDISTVKYEIDRNKKLKVSGLFPQLVDKISILIYNKLYIKVVYFNG